MTTTWTIRRDGRDIAVHDLTPGAPAGAPVVLLCHAAPGSGLFDPDPDVTAAHGVRLLSLDRPGYGGSAPVADRFTTIGDAADDAAAVLAGTGARAGVVGWSAGGRVALALAARHPELVGRVAVVGAPAPDEDVPWYGDENRAMVHELRGLPPADALASLTGIFSGVPLTPEVMVEMVGVGPADAGVLTGPVRERLRVMLDAATAHGVAGLVDDLAGYALAAWDFRCADVAAEVLLAYGADDERVPPPHGEWYRDRLPSARLELFPGVGHLVVVPAWDRVLDRLVRILTRNRTCGGVRPARTERAAFRVQRRCNCGVPSVAGHVLETEEQHGQVRGPRDRRQRRLVQAPLRPLHRRRVRRPGQGPVLREPDPGHR